MDNPVRNLRERLGKTQHQFGAMLDRSHITVQNWEAGKRVPSEIMEKMRTIAMENGLASIALMLGEESDHQPEVTMLEPGQTLISSHSAHPAHIKAFGGDERQNWHSALDYIFDSHIDDAIAAVKGSLSLAAQLASLRAPKRRASRHRS